MRPAKSYAPITYGPLPTGHVAALGKAPSLGLVLTEQDIPQASRDAPGAGLAPAVLQGIDTYVNGLGQLNALKPDVSLVIAYRTLSDDNAFPCNGVASRTGAFHPGSHLIRINVDAIAALRATAVQLLADDAVVASIDAALLADRQAKHDPAWLNQCVLTAALMLFFHELAHVVRGHLGLLGASALTESPEAAASAASAGPGSPRRVLETDADYFGALCLGQLLRRLSDQPGLAAAAQERARMKWHAWLMLGSFTLFWTMAKSGQLPNDWYHSPLVRFHTLKLPFAHMLGIPDALAEARLRGFYDAMERSPHGAAFVKDYRLWRSTFDRDFDAWRETETQRVALERSGRLSAMVTP